MAKGKLLLSLFYVANDMRVLCYDDYSIIYDDILTLPQICKQTTLVITIIILLSNTP